MENTERKQALIRVLGCKVNQAEVADMMAELDSAGYRPGFDVAEPDVILAHTCCVTAKAEGKSRRAVHRLAELNPNAFIIVTGCLAEVNPSAFEDIADRSMILGTYEKDRLSDFLKAGLTPTLARKGASECCEFVDSGIHTLPGRSRNFLKVQDGCSQRCSYCVVPISRGPSRSMRLPKVLEHAESIFSRGCSEVVLTGIHLGAYGKDLEPRLDIEALVRRLLVTYPEGRFRLSSIEPQEISAGLIEAMSEFPRLCRHLHIPLQSGDDVILERMRRPYDTPFVKDLVHRIRASAPDVCLGFDVMVGFPGESEIHFQRTLDFLRDLEPAYLHVFPFSPRPGTPAASFSDTVPAQTARERVELLRELSGKWRLEFYSRFVAKILTAIAESQPNPDTGAFVARTGNYIPVVVTASDSSDIAGEFQVEIVEMRDSEVRGRVVG
jgi:threonylcarbamoyladenosine tRNA methylthiotransferase MtaB